MCQKKPLIILKIGGSVITDRNLEHPRPLRLLMKQIAREAAAAYGTGTFRLLMIHGAGSFGHPIVKRTGLDKGLRLPEQRLALGETQRLQTWLNTCFSRILLEQGLPVFQCQPSASAVMESGKLVNIDVQAVQGLLQLDMVPLLHGVPAYDRGQGCSILSGDELAAHLAERLDAKMVLHGTNVKGVFTSDPSQDPEACFLPLIDLRTTSRLPEGIGGSKATDVTGGMRKKLASIRRTRVSCQLFDATRPGYVKQALAGEKVGTVVLCGPETGS